MCFSIIVTSVDDLIFDPPDVTRAGQSSVVQRVSHTLSSKYFFPHVLVHTFRMQKWILFSISYLDIVSYLHETDHIRQVELRPRAHNSRRSIFIFLLLSNFTDPFHLRSMQESVPSQSVARRARSTRILHTLSTSFPSQNA